MSEYTIRTDTATITCQPDNGFRVGTVVLSISTYKITDESVANASFTVRMARRDAEALRDIIENVCDALAEQAAEAAMAR